MFFKCKLVKLKALSPRSINLKCTTRYLVKILRDLPIPKLQELLYDRKGLI